MSSALEKGIESLFLLSTRKSIGVTELAEHLNVNKSTAFRILNAYLEANLVEKNLETGKYKLGPAILQLSEQYYKNFSIVEIAKPCLQRLAAEIRESVHLCVAANRSAVVIEQVMSESRLVVNAKIGNSEPLHCSSVGKCLLAFTEEAARVRLLSGINYIRYTENTITNEEDLLQELSHIRAQGYAMDNGELSPDIRCIAAPVFRANSGDIYSVGVSGARSRMTDEKLRTILPALLKACKEISCKQ